MPSSRPGDRGGVLPQQQLGAQRRVDRDRPPRGGRDPVEDEVGPDGHEHAVGRARGEVRGRRAIGTTTGRTPLPSLPVDSATSCSAQSPKPGYGDPASPSTSLSTPCGVGGAEQRAQPDARVVGGVGLERGTDRLRGVEQLADVGAGEPARHESERGERRVAPADAGVGGEHGVAGLAGGLLEGRAGVGDDDDPLGRVDARRHGTPSRTRGAGCRSRRCRRTCWRPRRRSRRAGPPARSAPCRDRRSRAPVSSTPAAAQMTSGASDDPPMPHSTTWDRPASRCRTSSAAISSTSGREVSDSVDPGEPLGGLGLGLGTPAACRPGPRCPRRRRRRRAR